MTTLDSGTRTRSPYWLVAFTSGAAVAVALGVYSKVHDPSGHATWTLGFDTLIAMKVWLATAAGVFGLVQLVTALWMWGKLGSRPAPARLGTVHRISGTVAFLLTVPVGYSCLYVLGFESYSPRVIIHCVAGCVFYGAFVTKIFAVRARTSPGWMLPVVGGALFTLLMTVVLTSSFYWFAWHGLPTNAPY
jgi:hypothetical protein